MDRLNNPYARYRRRTLLSAAGIFAAAAIFALGVAMGNGTINVPVLRNLNPLQPNNVDPTQLWRVWNDIQEQYDGKVSSQDQLYGALHGLVASLGDPYSYFMTPTETQDFQKELAGKIEGIGAEIGIKDSKLVIIAPVDGSPSQKAGLKPGDVIVAVDGKPTQGLSLNDAVSKIRGKKGTKVTLTIQRAGANTDVTITRDIIQTKSVTSEVKDGYTFIHVSQFTEDTATDFHRTLADHASTNSHGIIIDLRENPGGFLDAAVAMSSEFLPQDSVVVRERTQKGGEQVEKATSDGLLKSSTPPIAILVDSGSASASEIMAGALRDNHKAVLIGEKTFGKGSVQDLENLPGGSSLRITIAHWFTPDGHGINHTGLTPDIQVPGMDQDPNAAVARAEEYLRSKE